jgi:negative regulator of sigma-B (phosphoserine phosphatase)
MVSTLNDACVEWAYARAAAPGHRDSGDEFYVGPSECGTVIAVLDGLGHGPAAASVARQGVRLLERAQTPDVLKLVRECHAGLRGSRGVVMSLAMFNPFENTMAWVGVGNVCGMLWCPRSSRRRTLLLRSGLLGDALPRLQASVVPVTEGDMLVFTTDGVAANIDDRLLRGESLQAMAGRILARCNNGHDDALVVVARYRGAVRQ